MRWSFRKSKRSMFGTTTVTHRGINQSIRTPVGTFSTRLFSFGGRRSSGGDGGGGGNPTSCLGCLVLLLGIPVLLVGGCLVIATIARPTKRNDPDSSKTLAVAGHTTNSETLASPRLSVESPSPNQLLGDELRATYDKLLDSLSTWKQENPEPAFPKNEARLFVDSGGSHTTRASIVAATSKTVKLKKDDGKLVDVQVDRLSELDQKHIKREFEAWIESYEPWQRQFEELNSKVFDAKCKLAEWEKSNVPSEPTDGNEPTEVARGFKFLEKKTESTGSRNEMELYAVVGEFDLSAFRKLCIEKKSGAKSSAFTFVVVFDDAKYAAFPDSPFTAVFGVEDRKIRHIVALFEYNSSNGFCELSTFEPNMWTGKAKREKL